MKSQHLAELIDSNVGSEYIKKWSNDWDTAVNKAKRDHIFGQFIPEIEPSLRKLWILKERYQVETLVVIKIYKQYLKA